MNADDSDEKLADTLRTGYAAPPPRAAFVADLRGRLRQEFRATRASDPAAAARPRRATWWRWAAAAAVLLLAVGLAAVGLRDTSCTQGLPREYPGPTASSTPGHGDRGMVPLRLALPRPTFICTPQHIRPHPHLEPYVFDKPRPPFMVPEGTVNVALGKPVTSSERTPIIGEVVMVTDGRKEIADDSYVELGPGPQWVQMDLREPCHIYAIVVWHYFGCPRVYRDVVVQVSDDPDFIQGVRTLYNNDYDNSSGLGLGKNLEYVEDYRGRLIDAQGITARYVRLYTSGNIDNDLSHYAEVEVHGRPVPAEAAPPVPLETTLPRPRFD